METKTFAVGDLVVVSIPDRAHWNEEHAAAFEGATGRVEAVIATYSYPVALGGRTPVTGYCVAFAAPIVVRGRPVTAFHFDAPELRHQADVELDRVYGADRLKVG